MNTNNVKKYAPLARTQFRAAALQKMTTLGISADKNGALKIVDAEVIGNTVRFGQFDYPASVLTRRDRLVERARDQGLNVLIEHNAYTWFNRLCALRYMEIHGYLEHGFRVLSHPDNATGFEILDHVPDAADSLTPEKKAQLVEMKLAGNQEEALYRALLLAQCHALHRAMPFLFEAMDDEAELLLPDNLTRTDSILRGLVDSIPEEEWRQVEVIGWLYQFYISEKKDQVIGKVVKSEDIPAATQLFTPNWIVQYLVQNSVGRQWLQTYPDSPLKAKMDYYIEPAEQMPEVLAQLAAITPASLKPENIKVLDPACGSGHILIEAYNVLKHIYEERGYRSRDIPQLILENNIFGLDIDDRAAQLSGFALMMMARQDDRRIFSRDCRLNIVSLQESQHLDSAKLWRQLNFYHQHQTGSVGDMFTEHSTLEYADSAEYRLLERTLALFVNAKTLGSLIQVPQEDEAALIALLAALYRLEREGDIAQKAAAKQFIPIIHQAWILAQRYDAVVANPPYMGGKGMNAELKAFAAKEFPDSKSDLFAMFMQHGFYLLKENGFNAQINMQSWMFLSSYEKLREWLLDTKTFITMAHLGARAFSQISGEVVQTTAWVINNYHENDYLPTFFRLTAGNENEKSLILKKHQKRFDSAKQKYFKKIPGAPISYWLSHNVRDMFSNNLPLYEHYSSGGRIKTHNDEKFIRFIWEISVEKRGKKWIELSHGGEFKKWYGNKIRVVDWSKTAKSFYKDHGGLSNSKYWGRVGITSSKITSSINAFRFKSEHEEFSSLAPTIIPTAGYEDIYSNLIFLNSSISTELLKVLNPTLTLNVGDVLALPFISGNERNTKNCLELIRIAKSDWDSFEISYDFQSNPMINNSKHNTASAYEYYYEDCAKFTLQTKTLEEQNNNFFIGRFKLVEDIEQTVQIKNITLNTNPEYRYPTDKFEVIIKRFQSDTLCELLSYSIGCMMGRYSLDREGLVYAHEGNAGFAELVAEGAYTTFPADSDGILPLMDSDWFDDDITARVKEFVRVAWGEEHLQENLNFIAESLCLYAINEKKGESALETLHRYLSTQFWKDHLKMYKKRPIYWLFSSGKEKAFECLVYLHRYNEATLARMRTEYVVPLLARYQGNIDRLNDLIDSAGPGGEGTRLKRERDGMAKKFNELRGFDDRLRHFADRRIAIDLDDGVKVNYGKFGSLLADVKVITGSAPEII